jgi:hypothetical protein
MMVEGVHNGSQGAILHPISELGKFPESWNGIPIVIYHPEQDGHPVSANSPDIIDSVTVGRVYNTNVDGTKLKAEAWFDEDKLNRVSPQTLSDINDGKEIEVSLGMFTENEDSEGVWNGENYMQIAHNHRPDHLAILPDQVGACSCEDGCGLGANQENKDMERVNVDETIKSLNTKGFRISQFGSYADLGFQQKISLVNDALHKLDVNTYHYLEEVYDDYLIYSISGEESRKMYKQGYTLKDGKVELTGDVTEVLRKVNYVNANKDIQSSTKVDAGAGDGNLINLKKEDTKMSKASDCPKCLEKVNALIANAASPWKEENREWLLTQDESVLDKLAPVVQEVEKTVEKIVEVNKLSATDQADLAWARKQREEKRSATIKGIQDNAEGVWDEATLKTMNDDMLEKVFKSIKKETVVDYSMNASYQNNTASVIEPLLPAGVVIETKK